MSRSRKKILNPITMLLAGLFLGVASRLFDIYFDNLGNIFSQMAVWILLGTLIAIYSPTKKAAMLNILPFCLGMLVTYYAVAVITRGVYSVTVIIGWTVFALLSPHYGVLCMDGKGTRGFSEDYLRRNRGSFRSFKHSFVRPPAVLRFYHRRNPDILSVFQKDKKMIFFRGRKKRRCSAVFAPSSH